MPPVKSIQLDLQTADTPRAGCDGHVYLGVCGREFKVNTPKDDFERDASDEVVFGENNNVENSEVNDPRAPQLFTEQAEQFPMYLRFDPKNSGGEWILQRAQLAFNENLLPRYEALGRDTLEMGRHASQFIYLAKHDDT